MNLKERESIDIKDAINELKSKDQHFQQTNNASNVE